MKHDTEQMNTPSDAIEPFRRHYEEDSSLWGKSSGAGSDAYHTIEYRLFLEKFIVMNGTGSIVDIGCGDWQFSRFVNFNSVKYLGLDVVASVVYANRKNYSSKDVSFELMPANISDVPSADLLLIKDVLQHLPDADILRFRDVVFPKFKHCLITNSHRKLNTPVNGDIKYGEFRCLDLKARPYFFKGSYVLEFASPLWERIRTLLYEH